MKRAALLIASERGGRAIPGVHKDVANLKIFLQSDIGGAWNSNEIIILVDPTEAILDTAVSNLKDNDFAFISYSGHGFHSKNIDQTKMCLRDAMNNNVEVPIFNLIPDCQRHTISIDCCRHVEEDILIESRAYKAAMESLASARPKRERYRKLFDAAVEQAEKGGILLYSCNLNESAAEDSNGGCFTYGLIKNALAHESKTPKNENHYLGVDEALDLSAVYLKSLKKQQTPQLDAGRRRYYFPFSVYPSLF